MSSYTEIEKLSPSRVMGFYVKDKNIGQISQVASEPQDVRYSLSLFDAISELREFDDNTLFPYVLKLKCLIEDILQPSPMVF